jgi:geranylgeranyl diphosphate synthase type I
MSLEQLGPLLREAIERELQRQVARLDAPAYREFHGMLHYHMGWSGEGAGPEAQGKRIRPLLLLLSAAGAGGDWQSALPAAAAVELLHNFSLVHDDIQDHSPKRHGRATLWTKWGAAMAINAGDALFVLANQAILDLAGSYAPEVVLRAAGLLQETCLALTGGQFLDMSFEKRRDLTVEDYWRMISGKTAALLAASTEIGALLGGANEAAAADYRTFGYELGLAFQVHDDLLGIWGDEGQTGKSVTSDLVEGKNSLPVLYGLGRGGEFAARWGRAPIQPEEAAQLAELLAQDGARAHAQQEALRLTGQALHALERANPLGPAGIALAEVTDKLLNRKS